MQTLKKHFSHEIDVNFQALLDKICIHESLFSLFEQVGVFYYNIYIENQEGALDQLQLVKHALSLELFNHSYQYLKTYSSYLNYFGKNIDFNKPELRHLEFYLKDKKIRLSINKKWTSNLINIKKAIFLEQAPVMKFPALDKYPKRKSRAFKCAISGGIIFLTSLALILSLLNPIFSYTFFIGAGLFLLGMGDYSYCKYHFKELNLKNKRAIKAELIKLHDFLKSKHLLVRRDQENFTVRLEEYQKKKGPKPILNAQKNLLCYLSSEKSALVQSANLQTQLSTTKENQTEQNTFKTPMMHQ